MRRKSVLAAVLLITLAGCSGGGTVPCGDPAEITKEMARVETAVSGTLPLFTHQGKFSRHVALSELDDRGYMVDPESRRLIAVPIKNDKNETFALQEFKYEFADCGTDWVKKPGDEAVDAVLETVYQTLMLLE